jgi:DMSO/TMAO reductase YedYZ heme-binding membrane subunit
LLSSYRAFAVALGVVAAYSAVLVHASFSWRRSIGVKTWRKLHYVSFFTFAAALLHGLLAGSDAGAPGMQALYISSATAVAGLGLYRVLRSTRRPALARRSGGVP